MFPLLDNILKRRGIKNITELTSDEKVEFDKLQRMADRLHKLETEVITVEGIEKFCKQEKAIIEKEWHDNADVSNNKEIYLKVQHKIYDSLIKYIESPKAERDNIVNYLENLAK